jgi:hypothetical protein
MDKDDNGIVVKNSFVQFPTERRVSQPWTIFKGRSSQYLLLSSYAVLDLLRDGSLSLTARDSGNP